MSLTMAVTRLLLRAQPKSTASAASLHLAIAKHKQSAPLPRGLLKVAHVEETVVHGRPVIQLTPKHPSKRRRTPEPDARDAWLIYMHGGAYVSPILGLHWMLLATLIKSTGISVTVPLYGLAPEHHVDEAYALLEKVYDETVAKSAGGRVFLAGDSAGGGLALGQAMRSRDQRKAVIPVAVILFSPWLDVTMGNPQITVLKPLDPMLGTEGLREAGRLWAGQAGVSSPLVSPLFGDLAGLPPVFIYQGGRDVLAPDAKRVTRAIVASGGQAELRFYPRAFHVFVAAQWTPEARRALRSVADVLRKRTSVVRNLS